MEPIGTKIRRQRRRLGLTLEEAAARAVISKPYLSLIETGRVPNPPSDGKLASIEQTLELPAGRLVLRAHFDRTPDDIRSVLASLLLGQDGDAAAMLTADALRELLTEQPPTPTPLMPAPPLVPPPVEAAAAPAPEVADTVEPAIELISDDPIRYEVRLHCARCNSEFIPIVNRGRASVRSLLPVLREGRFPFCIRPWAGPENTPHPSPLPEYRERGEMRAKVNHDPYHRLHGTHRLPALQQTGQGDGRHGWVCRSTTI